MARLDLDLGTERQVGGSSHTHGLKLPPHLSEPSTSDPRPPLFDATAQSSIEFDALAYLAALDAPLPTNTGWEHLPPRISDVTEMSFIVPKVMSWLAWSEIPAKEGLNGKGSPTTELDTLSSEILVTPLPPQLHLGPQGQTQEKMGAKFDCSSSLGARTPEERPTVAQEIGLGAIIETAAPLYIIYPPSPISEVSPQTHEAGWLPDTGQNLFPHPSDAINTLNLKGAQIHRQLRALQPLALPVVPSIVGKQPHWRFAIIIFISPHSSIRSYK